MCVKNLSKVALDSAAAVYIAWWDELDYVSTASTDRFRGGVNWEELKGRLPPPQKNEKGLFKNKLNQSVGRCGWFQGG